VEVALRAERCVGDDHVHNEIDLPRCLGAVVLDELLHDREPFVGQERVLRHAAPRADESTDRRLGRVTTRITRADVEHVARLARLALTDDEIERFAAELASIIEHSDDVAALELDDVAPTAHPLPLVNVFRADSVEPTLDRDEVLSQAPATEDGRFRVPRILDAP
jgi:aspartyl-tRNA(Asn)/glutamyl-tRNA(Gln) amidotransferase subunit C